MMKCVYKQKTINISQKKLHTLSKHQMWNNFKRYVAKEGPQQKKQITKMEVGGPDKQTLKYTKCYVKKKTEK